MDIVIANNKTENILQNIHEKKFPILISLFLILNTLKIAVFNMFLTSPVSVREFIYKTGVTFLVVTLVYFVLMEVKTRFVFIAFYILQSVYIFINIIYFMYFHSYLHIAQALALLSESMGGARDLSALMNYKLLLVLLDTPLAVYIVIKYQSFRAHIKSTSLMKRAVLVLSCLLVIVSIDGWNYIHHEALFQIEKANDSTMETLAVQKYGTLANSLADMALNGDSSKLIKQLSYGNNISSAGTNSTKPNFVVIQVESMDANAINAKHYGKYIMPFMHWLSERSVYYPYMMSYHEAGGTSDCEFSVMNSIEPLNDYPVLEISDYNYPNSIVRQLDNSSYTSVAFHGDVGSYYQRNTAYAKMGFQTFYDLTKMGLEESGWGAPDGNVFKYAENKLETINQPFFAYTITMTSHGPFTNAANYYNNNNYSDISDTTTRDYMNSMSYVDQSIENYINYIRSNFKNTYIIIYGDHTPDVNNSYYKQASFTQDSRYFEFVPLVIVTPENKSYKEQSKAVSFIDIAPTIANASGVSYSLKSNGADLLNRTNIDSSISYRGGVFDRSYLYNMVSKTGLTH